MAEPIRAFNSRQRPHICQQPVDKPDFGEQWTCPECGLIWSVTVDENDDPSAYWDLA